MNDRAININISIRRLHDVPDAGLIGSTTPEERLALVETLTGEAWALSNGALPEYARGEAPVSMRPLRTAPGLPNR